MIQQIEHLCKELSITAKVNAESDNKSSELTLRHNSKLLLDKIASRQYEISSEEIRSFSERDLQNIITGILDYDNKDDASVTQVPIHYQCSDDFVDLTKKPIESELLESKEKAATTITTTTATSDDSTKYFDVVTKDPDVNSKEVLCKLDEDENVCTDLIPVSLASENSKTDNDTTKIENKTILITSDELATSVKISQSTENKEVTIINLEVNKLHNDLVEINKNLTEGFLHLKETIVIENPVKDEITPKATNEIIEETEEVSIKKNEITQTPFSEEIAHFFDKLPENLPNTGDKNPKKIVFETKSKDVLHFVGITEKAEIENVTETYKQINIYEPINIKFTNTDTTNTESETSSQNFSARKVEGNFISTVNSLILDRMNDLFEPIVCKDIVPNIFVGDYYKYENRNNIEDKYIKDKYKLHRENVDLYKPQKPVSQKLSEISLSEGEIVVNAKPKRKENPNILKVLEKYECKTCDYNSINKYKLNKFELNCDSSMRNVQFLHSSSDSPLTSSKNSKISTLFNRRESLLSDGEIKYSSDSDDCKTNYSYSSSKV